VSNVLDVFKEPKVVITSGDGYQLWIDPLKSDGTPGLLSQYRFSAQFGDPPADSDQITTCLPCFAIRETIRFMASPGPVGIPWGIWVAGAIYGAVKLIKNR
jgi:hypothetical protein